MVASTNVDGAGDLQPRVRADYVPLSRDTDPHGGLEPADDAADHQ
jgi:hypothetical protein